MRPWPFWASYLLIVLAAVGGIVAVALWAPRSPSSLARADAGGAQQPPASSGPSVKCPITTTADLARVISPAAAFAVPGCASPSAAACSITAWFNDRCVMSCGHTLAVLKAAGDFVTQADGTQVGVTGSTTHPTEAEATKACALARHFRRYASNAEENPGVDDRGLGLTNFYLGVAACVDATYKC